MKISRPLYYAAGIAGTLLLFLVLTILFIPNRDLKGLVSRGCERYGYTFRAAEFGKALPLGISARGIELGDQRGPLLKAERITARLQLLPLFLGRCVIAYHARLGTGKVDGTVTLAGQGESTVSIAGVSLEDIPFFATATGAQVKGILKAQGALRGQGNKRGGELQLDVQGAELRSIKIGETPLPDASYRAVQGMLRGNNGKATLESFTLQGDGLYVRLKGDLPLITPPSVAPLNLTLELMPKPEFLERQKFVFLLLVKYLDTPGHYQIPIRGTLGKPVIQ